METWNESVDTRDVRDRKYADEDDGGESKESKDLMWRLKVFGLFQMSVLFQESGD
jgi:hypothetical protein